MNNIFKNKDGSLSAKMFITFLLLIVGFGIILFFLVNFIRDPLVDRTVCKQSVIYRGTVAEVLDVAGGAVPLKCKEAKYCITTGLIGGKCNEPREPFHVEDNIIKVRVSSKEDIEKFLAREILSCWETMGEGKVSLMKNEGFWGDLRYLAIGDKIRSTCLICSRVAFDKKRLNDSGINYEEVDLFEYMVTHRPPDIPTQYKNYIQYIGRDTGSGVGILNEENLPEISQYDEIEEEEMPTKDEIAIVFSQIHAPNPGDSLNKLGRSAGVSMTGSVFAFGIKSTLKAAFSKVAIPIVGLIIGVQQYNVHIARGMAAGYCGDIVIGGKEREGCSVIRTMAYDAQTIGQYCSTIESIP